jgi:cytochrome c oxidase assembly protein subunit 15
VVGSKQGGDVLKALISLSLLCVMLLVSLSAYLRLSHSGIGCLDWPACYGRIGEPMAIYQPFSGENVYQRIVAEASQPLAWATPLHRFVASTLGLLIVFLVMLCLSRKKNRLISLLLLGITIFLALLGLKSGGLHSPAVVMGNLSGGFLMLGLLGWMLFNNNQLAHRLKGERSRASIPAPFLWIAVLLLVCQMLLGGLTSAHFAATSCQSLPDCHGSWLPGVEIWQAMDLSENHQVTSTGQVIGGKERIAIHMAHRLGAVTTVLIMLLVAVMAYRAGGKLRVAGYAVLILVALEFSIGIAAILSGLPISLAVAHNWLAGLLLLALLKIVALNRAFPENI